MVDLTPYALERYNNGSQEAVLPSGESLDLQGTLAPGQVYVVANSEAAGPIVSVADTLSTVTWVNGNDALVLRKNGEIIDQMGIIGEDPMGSWAVGEGAMSEYTLVRKPNIGQGSTDWSEGQTNGTFTPKTRLTFWATTQRHVAAWAQWWWGLQPQNSTCLKAVGSRWR